MNSVRRGCGVIRSAQLSELLEWPGWQRVGARRPVADAGPLQKLVSGYVAAGEAFGEDALGVAACMSRWCRGSSEVNDAVITVTETPLQRVSLKAKRRSTLGSLSS